MKKSCESLVKFLCDYLPLLVFFAVYKLVESENPLIAATIYMVITSAFALLIAYFLTGKIALMPLVSAVILGIFGGLTILFKDDIFIKIKPTIINAIFAMVLFYGYLTKKPFLSYLVGDQIKMSVAAWLTLSWRWAWFFVFLAMLNEIIWRFFSTDFWVQFKVFGITPLSLVFTLLQLPFMMKKMKEFDKKSSV